MATCTGTKASQTFSVLLLCSVSCLSVPVTGEVLEVVFNYKHQEHGITRNENRQAGQVPLLTAPVSVEDALHSMCTQELQQLHVESWHNGMCRGPSEWVARRKRREGGM